uniref:Neurotransmitter-gated ion-channel ligand-binding domain-containing protein n=1 Tax=Romanomermis culicivorax TaxID=13658 RepID=A0A915J6H1_ROMCU
MYINVDSNFDSTYHSNVVVYSNGKIVWIPPGNLRSSCNIDIKWFPFDDQKCYLKFGSWTYNGFKLDLREMSKNIDISEYIENGEWALIDVPVERNVRRYHYDSAPEEFIDLKFYLHLRRRTLYYAFNMIVPSLLILLMTILEY